MKVGTILLTANNQYVKDDGSLPKRPKHDKELLTALATRKVVSLDGYNMLPPSIQKLVLCTNDTTEMPITIPEISQSDLLIVSKSADKFEGGKIFRFDNFKCLVKDRKVEIWIKMQ